MYSLIACLKVDVLILNAVVSGTGVYEDASKVVVLPPSLAGKHVEHVIFASCSITRGRRGLLYSAGSS